MNVAALVLALISLLVVLGTWVAYFARLPSGNIPVEPKASLLLQGVGTALASAAMTMGLLFVWLYSQRKTPVGDLRIAVGDALLPFDALTDEGAAFHSDALRGKRTLFKFFRGSW